MGTTELPLKHGYQRRVSINTSSLPHIHCQVRGLSPHIFNLITNRSELYSSTMIPGRILPPYLGDRIGHYNVITACSLLTAVSVLTLWLPFNYHPSQAGIIVFALAYGLVSGAFVSLLMPCVAMAGALETLGQRFGTFQTVIGLR